MKLYTEEQVNQILLKNSCFCYPDPDIDKVLSELTPIELPSDEKIEQYADFVFPDAEKIGKEETYIAYKGFIAGAEWLKEQIINQTK